MHHLGDVLGDLAEGGMVLQHLGGYSMHMGGAGIHARIDQADHRVLHVAVTVECEGRDAEHPGVTGTKAGGLYVDHNPAVALCVDRPAPGVAHNRQDGTRA